MASKSSILADLLLNSRSQSSSSSSKLSVRSDAQLNDNAGTINNNIVPVKKAKRFTAFQDDEDEEDMPKPSEGAVVFIL